MDIAISVLFAILLVYLLARLNPFSRGGEDGLLKNRIGDGLRKLKALKRKYAVMTESLLMAAPDDELLEAVLANLWAKMAPDLSDAHGVMRGQSEGRRHIYALYAVTGGVRQSGFAAVRKGEDASLLPGCAQALEAIGAPSSADLLRRAMAADDPSPFSAPYLESFDAEDAKAKMVAYIRKNPEAFCDLI